MLLGVEIPRREFSSFWRGLLSAEIASRLVQNADDPNIPFAAAVNQDVGKLPHDVLTSQTFAGSKLSRQHAQLHGRCNDRISRGLGNPR